MTRSSQSGRSGDTAAYERLVRGYQEVAFRTAYLITGDASEAEEATQEAFVKAYRALERFRSGARFRPWLLAIVANEARNQRGRPPVAPVCSCGRPGRTRRRIVLPPRGGDPGGGAARRVARGPGQPARGGAVGYRCRYFLGLSEEETAAILGCARGTVKSRLSRALKSLRTEIAKEEMQDRELERELRGLLIDYPPTPDVAHAARSLLDEEEDSRPQGFRMVPKMRWAAAAAFVLLVAVPTLSPSLRATVSDWFVAEDIQSAGGPAVDAGSSERQSEAGAPRWRLQEWDISGLAPRFLGSGSACVRRGPQWMARSSCPELGLGKPDEVYAGRPSGKEGVVFVYRKGFRH